MTKSSSSNPRQEHSASTDSKSSFAAQCLFCTSLRIFEGGGHLELPPLGDCAACGSRVAIEPDEQAAVLAILGQVGP